MTGWQPATTPLSTTVRWPVSKLWSTPGITLLLCWSLSFTVPWCSYQSGHSCRMIRTITQWLNRLNLTDWCGMQLEAVQKRWICWFVMVNLARLIVAAISIHGRAISFLHIASRLVVRLGSSLVVSRSSGQSPIQNGYTIELQVWYFQATVFLYQRRPR